jgi:hypothetical protein
MYDRIKKVRDRLLPVFTSHRTTLIDILGGMLITIGIFMIFIPAGFIFAGIACLIISSRLPENGEVNGESIEEPF